MKRLYSYKKIDAFTAEGSLGNPAACLYLEAGQELSEKEMLFIAKQHKGFVSEVVYCTVTENGIGLRYYSSECEVDFCGHGTVACMHQLIRSSPALLSRKEFDIQTYKKGRSLFITGFRKRMPCWWPLRSRSILRRRFPGRRRQRRWGLQ